MGGLWRLYYGGFFGQRLLGKYGPLTFLAVALAANLWFSSDHPWTVTLALPMAALWIGGFGGWDRWDRMVKRYLPWTVGIACAWAVLEWNSWLLVYGLSGLSGLAYPIGNRIQPTPWLGYTQWSEVITGVAMIDTVVLLAWLLP